MQDAATGARFVLLGAGYGAFSSSTPGVFLGSLSPDEQSGSYSMLAVCGPTGAVAWYPSTQLTVSVGGQPPSVPLV